MNATRDSVGDELLDEVLRALCDLPESLSTTHLLRCVAQDRRTLARVTDPGFLTDNDAVRLAARIREVDRGLDVQLLELIERPGEPPGSGTWRGGRALTIFASVSDSHLVATQLPALLRHPDARIRSKAALLAGGSDHNLRWLAERLSDENPRVRANAVQAAWGSASPEARSLFLAATRDSNYRVVANGVVGLHKAGDLLSARMIGVMLSRADWDFRCAAVWAMGETQDPRFLPVLDRILGGTKGSVRRNALRAVVRIRARLSALAGFSALRVGAVSSRDGIAVRVRSGDGVELTDLPATAFVVTSGAAVFDIQEFRRDRGSYKLGLNVGRPEFTVSVFARDGMGQTVCRNGS